MYNVLINIATDYMIVFRLQSYDIISKVVSVAYGKFKNEPILKTAEYQTFINCCMSNPMEINPMEITCYFALMTTALYSQSMRRTDNSG